jgi:hypothetical protein
VSALIGELRQAGALFEAKDGIVVPTVSAIQERELLRGLHSREVRTLTPHT